MRERLIAASDVGELQRELYPLILRNAGKRMHGGGIVLMIVALINEALKDHPHATIDMALSYVPDFIDAVTDDNEAAAEAKAHYESMMTRD
jgi:hypothetical protein